MRAKDFVTARGKDFTRTLKGNSARIPTTDPRNMEAFSQKKAYDQLPNGP